MGWEEGSKTPLFSEKQGEETERKQEPRSFPLPLPLSPHPTPLTTQVPDSFCEKTSLQTHFDFWEAAQLHSLPSFPLPGLGARSPAGRWGGGTVGSRAGCRGPGASPTPSLRTATTVAGTLPSGRPQAPRGKVGES